MSLRVLAVMLLWCAALRAGDPGVMVEGTVHQFAQDAEGTVWAITDGRVLAVLAGQRWEPHPVPDLGDLCKVTTMEKFADGDVGCLWRDPHGVGEAWVLTRHRAGKSRVAARFSGNLREPALHGLGDGHVVITEAGRSLVVIFPDERKPVVKTLADTLFVPPEKKQTDGSLSKEHAPVRAIADGSGSLWLWSPEMERQRWRWRLGGLVRVGEDLASFRLFVLGKNAPPVSACVSWDEKYLAFALVGEGLFLLDSVDKADPKRMAVPDAAAFKYIDQLFHDGSAWHAVTTPRPTEVEVLPSQIAGNIALSQRFFYDRTKPVCALWRYDAGAWKRLHDGLDKVPIHERPWLRTESGLFLGSDAGPPWFFPADGAEPRRLASAARFPLPAVGRMSAVDEKQLLLAPRNGGTAWLWPAEATAPDGKAQRWEEFTTRGQALQDARGHIWLVREDNTFARWDGGAWKNFAPPPANVAGVFTNFIPDDRGRGWAFPDADEPTAICDFATGQWRTFASVREALVDQLPRGVKLRVPEHPFYEPAFAGDGRIGVFRGLEKILLHEEGRWREWTLPEIAGAERRLGGTPFFAADGKFSVPLNDETVWQWHGEKKGWQLANGVEVPKPGTMPNRETVRLPDGGDLNRLGNDHAVRDRHGVIWLLRKGGVLCKIFPGREVRVFNDDEPNPFRHVYAIHHALADDAGNVLLDTTELNAEHKQIFLRPRLPVPASHARLAENTEDTARIILGETAAGPLWHTWCVDGGPWQPLRETRELKLDGLLPGKHTVEVRAFNAELTPAKAPASVEFVTGAAAEAQFAASLSRLASPDLDAREDAARKLKSQGRAALPKLREARRAAPADAQWWLDAIIQHIERQPVTDPPR